MSVTTDTLYAGDPIRMTATFTDTAGLLTDPDTVTFRYVAPDLTQYRRIRLPTCRTGRGWWSGRSGRRRLILS